MQNLVLETGPGDHIKQVGEKAKVLAKQKNTIVEFDFNGIKVLIGKDSVIDWMETYYGDAHVMNWKTIGPDYHMCYDADTDLELAKLRLKQDQARKDRQVKQDAEDKAAENKVTQLTKDVVLLIHPDKTKEYEEYVTNNSKDGYSRAVIEYSEQWAKLMQIEISKGRTNIKDMAEETQKPLGYLGITGFQYGCVVNGLSHFWIFGEELRKWHNKEYGVSEDKKGVVNPAVLTISTK